MDEFLHRCPTLWHIAPEGAWESIKRRGFRTAEQLIQLSDLDEAEQATLLREARPSAVRFAVEGDAVMLRDQQSLLKRKDPDALMGDGSTVAEWIGMLNRRVYLFTDQAAMAKALARYIEADGPQEVITFSPRRFFEACRPRIELSAQHSGSAARATAGQKRPNTFVSVGLFPSGKRPSEVTVVDGIDDLTMVAFVERHDRDGVKTPLPR